MTVKSVIDDEDEFGYHDHYENEDEDDDEPCSHCGPWCSDWLGDNLCQIELDMQMQNDEEYHKSFFHERALCPVCHVPLHQYDIKSDTLWNWPGDWFDPFIPLFEIYHAYAVSKGAIHAVGNIYHIWIGEGNLKEEKLIKLLGKYKP